MALLGSAHPHPPLPTHPPPPAPPSSLPSTLLPSSSSLFQRTLRAASTALPPLSDAPTGTYVPSDDPNAPLDHLAWSTNSLTWSTNGQVYRTFDFSDTGEAIACALLASFDVPDTHPAASTSSAPPPSPSSSSSLFGPYSNPPRTTWTDDALSLPSDPPSPSFSSNPLNTRKEKTLLVVLSTLAFAFPESGGRVPVPVPCRIRRAWAVEGGVLLERAAEGREVWDAELRGVGAVGGSRARVPTLWSLTGLMEELRPAALVDDLSWSFEAPIPSSPPATSDLTSAALTAAAPIRVHSATAHSPLADLDERILFASSSSFPSTPPSLPHPRVDALSSFQCHPPCDPPILVTSNPRTRKLRVYAYARVGAGAVSLGFSAGGSSISPSAAAGGKGKARAVPRRSSPGLPSSSPTVTRATAGGPAAGGGSALPPTSLPMTRTRTSLSGTKRKHPSGSGSGDELLPSASAGGPSSPFPGSSSRPSSPGPEAAHLADRSLRRPSALAGPAYPSSLPGRPRTSLTRLASLTAQAGAAGLEAGEAELLMEAAEQSFELSFGAAGGGEGRGGKGGGGRRPAGPDRRVSLTRGTNELSVTMDRMALSQGSSVGGGGGPSLLEALAEGGERARERDRDWAWGGMEREAGGATFMVDEGLGEEDGEGRGGKEPEVAVKLVWEGDAGEGNLDGTTAFLFDTRTSTPLASPFSTASSSASSPYSTLATTSSILAVHLPSSSSLLLFQLHLNSPAFNLSLDACNPPLHTLSCTPLRFISPVSAAAPVLALRADVGVRDALYLSPGGRVGLLTADTREVDLPAEVLLPPELAAAAARDELIGVEGNGAGQTVFTLRNGVRRRVSLPSSPSTAKEGGEGELAQKCLTALSQVHKTEDYVQLFSTVLGRAVGGGGGSGKGKGRMTALEEVLDEAFGVDIAPPALQGEGRENDPFEAFLAASSSSASASTGIPDPLLSLLRPSFPALAQPTSPSHSRSAAPAALPSPQLQFILLALHLVLQDLRLLARPTARGQARRLAEKLAGWAGGVGLREWADEYGRMFAVEGGEARPRGYDPSSLRIPLSPPDILSTLSTLLTSHFHDPSKLLALTRPFSLHSPYSPLSPFYGSLPLAHPTKTTQLVLSLYSTLVSPPSFSTTTRSHLTVSALYRSGLRLDDLAFAIAVPLREAVRMAQLDPPEPGSRAAKNAGWVAGTYELVGRRDLARQLEPESGSAEAERTGQVSAAAVAGREGVDIATLFRGAVSHDGATVKGKEKEKAGGREKNDLLAPVPKAERFNEDKRFEEVMRMLQYSEPVVISAGDKTIDQLTPQYQQSILLALSARTLALPVGHGMFTFRTRSSSPSTTTSSSPFTISKLNTSARIVPMSSPVALVEKERDPSNPAASPDRLEWPDFHSGVIATLQLRYDPSTRLVDSSQISFNRPAELDARHAGLLFGLGLTGQLGAMLSSQAYEYLKAKHDPTSVGLLLGLAVSYLATSDPTVTSVVSIHLPALHPPRSSSLNVSGMTQAAAAVAIGLVHFGTGRRSYADVLLRELTGVKVSNVEDGTACREAYALSCGFGFGFVMLGKGREQQAEGSKAGGAGGGIGGKEVDHLRVFRSLIVESSATSGLDTSITSPAATVALALMYLRSERADVASIVDLPDAPSGLDYVRHDLLLFRTVARNLVLWNGVRKSRDWVESQLPAFLGEAFNKATEAGKTLDHDLDVARWSIVAGACFAIGLKFAGTAAAEAHATLIYYLDRLTRASYAKASTVQGKIKRHALRSSLGALSLALGMVMAGTGELNVLRRLRVAHGLYSEGVSYGSHLATHMALGLLFLGKGQYTLGNSDAAVAVLLLAFYPAFPATPTENRGHLQAYRHLWVLAVEPRYLDARDVDTGEPVFLPVKLRLVDKRDSAAPTSTAETTGKPTLVAKQLVAPTLIPDLAQIDSIQIDSPRYWSFALRLSSNPQHLARFLSSSTLCVKRRTGHLSYAQDPRGIRSIFTRSKSETGSSVFDLGEMARMLSSSAAGLRDFVTAFSGLDAEALAATMQLCYHGENGREPSAFEAFAASALLECLTKDKRDVVGVYHAIYAAASALDTDSLARAGPAAAELLHDAAQLRFLVAFYKAGAFKALFSKPKPPTSSKSGSSSSGTSGQVSRDPLLSPAFIDHLHLRLADLTAAVLADSSTASSLHTYLASIPSSSLPATPVLAYLLAALRFPPLSTLQQLRSLVASAVEQQQLGKDEVAVLLRLVGKKVAEEQAGGDKKGAKGKSGASTGGAAVGSAWEREAERWMVEAWVGGA